MVDERPAGLARSGFGRASVEWVQQPRRDAVPLAASSYIHHRVALHLRRAGFTAKHLSDEVGDSRPSWTNKLNGLRPFSIADLAVVALAVDPTIWDALPGDVTSPNDLLPPDYISLLSSQALGHGVPQFVARDDIQRAAAQFGDWWRAETAAGRQWALALEVALQQAALGLDLCGFPSSEASIGPRSDILQTIEWAARSVRLRILWLWPGRRDDLTVAEALSEVAALVWAPRPTPRPIRDVVIVGAPPTVVSNLAVALGFDPTDPPDSMPLSLDAAHRLGVEGVDADLPDQMLIIHRWEADVPLWLELKA